MSSSVFNSYTKYEVWIITYRTVYYIIISINTKILFVRLNVSDSESRYAPIWPELVTGRV